MVAERGFKMDRSYSLTELNIRDSDRFRSMDRSEARDTLREQPRTDRIETVEVEIQILRPLKARHRATFTKLLYNNIMFKC